MKKEKKLGEDYILVLAVCVIVVDIMIYYCMIVWVLV